jgi:hypothetical protein
MPDWLVVRIARGDVVTLGVLALLRVVQITLGDVVTLGVLALLLAVFLGLLAPEWLRELRERSRARRSRKA